MHLGLDQLSEFFDLHREAAHLVLATVIGTEGSTYRKAGAMLLVAPGGEHAGLISGGCLEADLVQHAAPVFEDGIARRLDYDLHDDPELLLGLGLGCGGDVHLLLQRLDRERGFGFLPVLFNAQAGGQAATLALVSTADGPLALGDFALLAADGTFVGNPALRAALAEGGSSPDGQRWSWARCEIDEQAQSVLLLRLEAPPHVLVCGAGVDAVPLVRQVRALGWRCTVTDHREAYARPERFPPGTAVLQQRPSRLADAVDLGSVSAAVVMSHHLGHDEDYLRCLLAQPLPYLGLLGPRRRRRQLADCIGVDPALIRGPAGLDIGAELPAAIALSIVAEIHAVLNHRDCAPLGRDD